MAAMAKTQRVVAASGLIAADAAHGTSSNRSSHVGLKPAASGAFRGLRSCNSVDMIQYSGSGMAQADPKLVKKGSSCAVHRRGASTIVSGTGGMNLVFVGAEMAPWSKTGGLGDVLGGLPPAMAANGHRVMVITPRYDQYKDAWDTSVVVQVRVGDKYEPVRFFHCYKRGVDRVFVDHPMFLAKVWGQTGSKLYGPDAGVDYPDNQLRYSLLCQAALEAPRVLNLNNNPYYSGPYGDDVVFVCNDWHTAALPCYLKAMYKPKGIYSTAKVAFCIHNVSYQGRFQFEDLAQLNLPFKFEESFDFLNGFLEIDDEMVEGRRINWMKAGITEADRVLTVSPYYAQELVSGEARGVELNKVLRRRGVTGIVNGMDVSEWNPMTDKFIAVNYNADTVCTSIPPMRVGKSWVIDGCLLIVLLLPWWLQVLQAKPINKEFLQAQAGLPVDRSIPVIAFIGRLEEQKGSDILAAALPEILDQNIQVILLGTGKKKMEAMLTALEEKFPEKVRAVVKFNAALAHHMIAGADLLAIPSRFEPCGLIQLQGLQYGTPSAVASTGGLVDTIIEGRTGFHMGRFNVRCEAVDPKDVEKVAATLRRAVRTVGTPAFEEMIKNCMAQDLSWKGPAKQWEEVLLSLGVAGSEPGIDGEEIAPLVMENVAAP